jgi:short-subunit dehydrogenase
MSKKPTRHVIILGATSAMAEHTARQLAAEGASLALVARDAGRLAQIGDDMVARGARNIVRHAADLARVDAPAALLEELTARLGGLDAILIFYGVLGEQARAEQDMQELRRIVQVNFTSAAEFSVAGARLLAARGSAKPVLLALGSVAGDRGRASNYVYGAAKAGLAALYQGLAHEYAATPLRVVLVKAGFVDTPMTRSVEKKGLLWAKPEQIGHIILRSMESGGPIVYAPWFWRCIMLVIRLLPQPVMNRLKI